MFDTCRSRQLTMTNGRLYVSCNRGLLVDGAFTSSSVHMNSTRHGVVSLQGHIQSIMDRAVALIKPEDYPGARTAVCADSRACSRSLHDFYTCDSSQAVLRRSCGNREYCCAGAGYRAANCGASVAVQLGSERFSAHTQVCAVVTDLMNQSYGKLTLSAQCTSSTVLQALPAQSAHDQGRSNIMTYLPGIVVSGV